MSELIERLLAEETDLTDCAIDYIEQLERERDAALAAQDYTYIGKDMKPILARDLEDAKDAAEAKLAKAVETLRWYADFGNYLSIPAKGSYPHIDLDKGGRAEDMLAELEGKE